MPRASAAISGRNAVTRPLTGSGSLVQFWPSSVLRATPIWERFSLLLRAEVFDLWNHPTYPNPGVQLTTSTNSFDFVNGSNVGSASTGMRLIQLSGRVTF